MSLTITRYDCETLFGEGRMSAHPDGDYCLFEDVEKLLEWQPIETAPKDGDWILAVKRGFSPCVVLWRGVWLTADDLDKGPPYGLYKPDYWMAFPGHIEDGMNGLNQIGRDYSDADINLELGDK